VSRGNDRLLAYFVRNTTPSKHPFIAGKQAWVSKRNLETSQRLYYDTIPGERSKRWLCRPDVSVTFFYNATPTMSILLLISQETKWIWYYVYARNKKQ